MVEIAVPDGRRVVSIGEVPLEMLLHGDAYVEVTAEVEESFQLADAIGERLGSWLAKFEASSEDGWLPGGPLEPGSKVASFTSAPALTDEQFAEFKKRGERAGG